MRYSDIWPRYAQFWDRMTINSDRIREFSDDAEVAVRNKATYQEISEAAAAAGLTAPPWYMLAVLHRRESDANFATYLGNGQSLAVRTTIEPRNRGPFLTGGKSLHQAFIDGGVDAIRVEGWGSIIDWRLEKILYYCMLFNGPGYEMHGLPSPYVWGGTNIQRPGKYVRDGVWSSTTWDPQPGCAPILAAIAKLDPTVAFTRED